MSNKKSLLPESIQDVSNLALEKCINEALNFDMSLFMICLPENLSDSALFARAKMLHILGAEGWNDCNTREEKIELINNAIKMHRLKGTVASIKTRLSGTNIEYLNWDKYEGVPNHFKVKVRTKEVINENTASKIIQAINENKRFSSKMDALEIDTVFESGVYLDGYLLMSRKITLK